MTMAITQPIANAKPDRTDSEKTASERLKLDIMEKTFSGSWVPRGSELVVINLGNRDALVWRLSCSWNDPRRDTFRGTLMRFRYFFGLFGIRKASLQIGDEFLDHEAVSLLNVG